MQDIKSIIPINSNSQPQAILQEQSKDLSFHDRAAIVARDILEQIGFDAGKMRMISQVTSLINSVPPMMLGPYAEAQKMTKEIEPLILMAQNNIDPGAYLTKIPQEKIEYFLNQVITRLEWVKYGNNAPETGSQEQQTGNHNTEDSNASS